MFPTLLTVLHAASALGAITFWAAAMYLWFLRNHSSRAGIAVTRRQIVLRFAVALGFASAAWVFRVLGESIAAP